MTQECENCPKCHKTGLPILLTRYAIALQFDQELDKIGIRREHGALWQDDAVLPKLSAPFAVTKEEDGAEIPLNDNSAQYTLRLLRPGYVYVYNKVDKPALRCYEVSPNGLLTPTPPDEPPKEQKDEKDAKPDAVCVAEKNLMTAYLLTIPYVENTKDVWIAFSDVKWTPHVAKKHENEAYRKRHMRKIDVAAWMAADSPQQPHAACLHRFDAKTSPVAEFVAESKSTLKEAFLFSDAPFNRKGAGVDLEKVRKVLVSDIAHFLGMENLRNSDEQAQTLLSQLELKGFIVSGSRDEQKAVLRKIWKIAGVRPALRDEDIADITLCAQHIKVNGIPLSSGEYGLTPFGTFIQEIERFYNRSRGGLQKNAPFKGKAMILALDDPAGLAMDLNGLMFARQEGFGKTPKYERGMRVSAGIERIRASVVISTAHKMADDYRLEKMRDASKWNADAKRHLTTQGEVIHTRDLTKEEEDTYADMREGNSEEVQKAIEKEWADYQSKLKEDGKGSVQDFMKDFTKNLLPFQEKFVLKLAEAHAEWMKSDRLYQYFDCNFDAGLKEHLLDGEAKPDQELIAANASEQAESYVELFSRCAGRTAEHAPGMELYTWWLAEAPQDNKNLLWRTLCLNQDSIATNLPKACCDFQDAQTALASLARKQQSAPGGNNAGQEPKDNENAIKLLRNMAFTWWDIHTQVQAKLHATYTIDAKAKIEEVKKSRKALREANKQSAKLTADKERILAREKELLAKQSAAFNEKLKASNKSLDASDALADALFKRIEAREGKYNAELILRSPEYKAITAEIAKINSTPLVSAETCLINRVLYQMQGPLKRLREMPFKPNFEAVRFVLSAHSGTPPYNPTLSGSHWAVGKAVSATKGRKAKKGAAKKTAFSENAPQQMRVRLPGSMDRGLMLDAFLIDGHSAPYGTAYTRAMAGSIETHAAYVRQPAEIWRLDREGLGWLVRQHELLEQKAYHDAKIEEARSNFAEADRNVAEAERINRRETFRDALAKERLALRDTEIAYNKQAMRDSQNDIASHQKEVDRIQAELDGGRAGAKEALSPQAHKRRVNAAIAGHGMAVVNTAIAIWCYGSIDEELEKERKKLGMAPEDEQYAELKWHLNASEAVLFAAGLELSSKAATRLGIGRLNWSPLMRRIAPHAVRAVGTVASTFASVVFGYWDIKNAKAAWERGDTGLMFAYGISFVLAATEVVIGAAMLIGALLYGAAAVAFLGPIALGVALIYMAWSMFVALGLAPSPSQKWLAECYFGKNNSYTPHREIVEFGELGFKPGLAAQN